MFSSGTENLFMARLSIFVLCSNLEEGIDLV